MSDVLIQALGIRKEFTKEREGSTQVSVLNGVDLDVASGERIAIMGPSGVGKSTLLHILGTLERPSSGDLSFLGERGERISVASQNETQLAHLRNRFLGFVFQFHHLLAEFSALENVMLPALIGGVSRRVAEKQARELLSFVKLSHRETHRPSELSGGEQQRVAIARAVILRPRVLLADEITGNLDSANSEQVLALLSQLNQSTGVAIVLVTHDPVIAKTMGRVLHMKDGRIEAKR